VRKRTLVLAGSVVAALSIAAVPPGGFAGVFAPTGLGFAAPPSTGAAKAGPMAAAKTVAAPGGFGSLSITQVGPKRAGGEPSIASGPDGKLFVSYPGSGMNFFRSSDAGRTWTEGANEADTQSGDTSVNVDSTGAVYQSNLNGINLDPDALQGVVYKSTDLGDHWTKGGGFVNDSNSTNQPFFVDRQWADAYVPPGKTTGQGLVYFTYHDWGPNQIWVNVSTDGGKTFGIPQDVITSPQAQADSFCDTIPGGIKVVQSGPHAGRVYVAWLAASAPTDEVTGCNVTQLDTFHSVWLAVSDDRGATWTDRLIFDGGFGHDASGLFADFTLDDQGNPYVAFADNLSGEWDMYVMASFDGGVTWNGRSDGTGVPYKVNADTGTHFFPAIAVGDPGRVDVAYIRTPAVIPVNPYGKPSPGGGDGDSWYVYMAQSTNVRAGSPTWNVVQAAPGTIHVGDVCTLGIFCIDSTTGLPLTGANRSLLDFIDIAVDPRGFAHAAYTADRPLPAGPNGIFSANQVSGTSVYPASIAPAAGNPASGAYTTTATFVVRTTRMAAGTAVTFSLGAQRVTAPVGSGGSATAKIVLNQHPGAYTLTATAAGVSASAPFTLTKDATTTSVARTSKTLQATLVAAGSRARVAGRSIGFFVNGTKVGTATTNSNGVADVKAIVAAHRTVKAVFSGDAFFTASSATTTT
jgi:hypothetical protein